MLLLVDPSTTAEDREVARLHDLARGRVVFPAPPNAATIGPVASALLAAMGKKRLVAPGNELAANEVPWARVWLGAHRVSEVIVTGAYRLSIVLLEALDRLVTESGSRLLVMVDPFWVPVLEDRLGARYEGPLEWRAALAEALATVRSSPPKVTSRTRDAIMAELIAEPVDDAGPAYLYGFAAASAYPRPEHPTAAQLASRLRGTLEPVTSPRCFAAAVDGAADAQLPYHWRITFEPRRFARGLEQAAAPAADEPFRSFWIFRDPLLGAGWALSCLPVTFPEILALTIDDVLADGSMVSVAGEWFVLPEHARPLLAAQRLWRVAQGAAPGDRLLVRRYGEPTSERWLASLCRSAAAEASVRTLEPALRVGETADQLWLRSRGVALEWLPRAQHSEVPDIGELRVRWEIIRDRVALLERSQRCDCQTDHLPPVADELAAWPPARRAGVTEYDVGIRRNAYGYRG